MGIVVTDSITTSSPTDIYATHDAHLGRGGYRSVLTYNELLATTGERKTEGMLVYVKETDKEYRWTDGQWVSPSVSSSIGEVLPTDNMELTDLVLFMRNGNLMSATIEQFKCVISSINAGGAVPICEANNNIIDGGLLLDIQTVFLDGGKSTQIIVSSVDGGASN